VAYIVMKQLTQTRSREHKIKFTKVSQASCYKHAYCTLCKKRI